MSTHSNPLSTGPQKSGASEAQAGPAGLGSSAGRQRLSLEEKTAELKVRRRDCRSCKAFRQDDSGMSFGWCTAFEQYVKLYHPAAQFWSQCQFKVIARTPMAHASTAAEPAEQPVPKALHPAWMPLPAAD